MSTSPTPVSAGSAFGPNVPGSVFRHRSTGEAFALALNQLTPGELAESLGSAATRLVRRTPEQHGEILGSAASARRNRIDTPGPASGQSLRPKRVMEPDEAREPGVTGTQKKGADRPGSARSANAKDPEQLDRSAPMDANRSTEKSTGPVESEGISGTDGPAVTSPAELADASASMGLAAPMGTEFSEALAAAVAVDPMVNSAPTAISAAMDTVPTEAMTTTGSAPQGSVSTGTGQNLNLPEMTPETAALDPANSGIEQVGTTPVQHQSGPGSETGASEVAPPSSGPQPNPLLQSGGLTGQAFAAMASEASSESSSGNPAASETEPVSGSGISRLEGTSTSTGTATASVKEPIAAAATPRGLDPNTQSVIDQVTKHLVAVKALRDGSHTTTMHLRPEALGNVTVTVNVLDGTVRMDVVASAAAVDVLNQGVSLLKDELLTSGFDLQGFTARSDQNPGQGNQPRQSFEPFPHTVPARRSEPEQNARISQNEAPARRRSGLAGRLDVTA